MENIPTTPLGNMYREHINLILKKDIQALLNQYTDDAVLISSFTADRTPKYYRGRKELEEHFQGILGIEGLETNIAFWGESDLPDGGQGLMIVEAITMTGKDGNKATMRFADSWVLRGGQIALHFAGMVQYPDGSVA